MIEPEKRIQSMGELRRKLERTCGSMQEPEDEPEEEPELEAIPDIPVNVPFVSRKHGLFQTNGMKVTYTAVSSTNGTRYRGRRLYESECVELLDGDILEILADRETGNYSDVIIECAFSPESQRSWNEIVKNQYDALTGLMNRRLFSQWFENHGVYEDGRKACFFVLDVDLFKQINDTYGHQNGDLALVTLAKTLESVIGPCGKVARWGGDEFVGLVFVDRERSVSLIKAITNKLSDNRINNLFTVGVSVGLAELYKRDVFDLSKIFSRADNALYAAKREGRNRIVFE